MYLASDTSVPDMSKILLGMSCHAIYLRKREFVKALRAGEKEVRQLTSFANLASAAGASTHPLLTST